MLIKLFPLGIGKSSREKVGLERDRFLFPLFSLASFFFGLFSLVYTDGEPGSN